jgi:hypothetical protein
MQFKEKENIALKMSQNTKTNVDSNNSYFVPESNFTQSNKFSKPGIYPTFNSFKANPTAVHKPVSTDVDTHYLISKSGFDDIKFVKIHVPDSHDWVY